jgi:putative DNA primase/helicase
MKPFHRVPEELRRLKHWLVWRTELRRNKKTGQRKPTKVPYCARTGQLAKSNDPATWSSFEAALKAFESRGYDGLGFVLTDTPYTGVDLDGCILDGAIEPWARQIIAELESYTERSPSGKGVHVIVLAKLPPGRRQKEFDGRPRYGVGLYDCDSPRYFTMAATLSTGTPSPSAQRRCL